MYPKDVENNVIDVYITAKKNRDHNDSNEGIIIWVVSNKQFTKRVFKRAAQVKHEIVRVISHIPLQAKKRKAEIENRLKEQKRTTDPDLKFSIRPGRKDLMILLKYKESDHTKMNPYSTISMEDFDKHGTLPPIETLALKRHNDNEVERKIREKFLKSKVNDINVSHDNTEGDEASNESWNKVTRKRGGRSPLMSEMNKKVKETNETSEAIQKFLSRRRNNEASEGEEEEDSDADEKEDDVFDENQTQ